MRFIMKKVIPFLLVIVFVLQYNTTGILESNVYAANLTESEYANKIAYLRSQFQAGQYWNYYSSPDYSKTGTSPCYCKIKGYSYCAANCSCACGQYGGAGQCAGYAYKLYNAIFNSDYYDEHYDKNSIYAGDIVRIRLSNGSLHSILVTKVVGDTLWITDCNFIGPCTVRWDAQYSRNALNVVYIRHYPGNTLTGNGSGSPTPPPASYGIPTLTNPANGASFQTGQTINFQWSNTGAARYRLEVMNDTGSGGFATDVYATSYSFVVNNTGSWRWQVRSYNGSTAGDAPPTRSFTVTSPPPDPYNGWTADGFGYYFANGTVMITGYNGSGGSISIPAQIDGYPVTSIGGSAFMDQDSITAIWIHANVSQIGFSPFSYCDNLTAINVDTGNALFSSSGGLLFNKDRTTLIACPAGIAGSKYIPYGVTRIGAAAFEGSCGLGTVIIPSTIQYIDYAAFWNCTGLYSAIFEGDCPIFGTDVFNNTPSSFLVRYYFERASFWSAYHTYPKQAYCYLTLDLQDGSYPVTYYWAIIGSDLECPWNPAREGFDFGGWCKDAAGTMPWNFGFETVTVNVTLYAKWIPLQPAIIYQSHVQDIGWQEWVSNGDISGTSGQSKRLEAISIVLANMSGGIEYRTHVQNIGWMDWTANGALSGTEGQSLRLEAIEIYLTGAAADLYDVYYRVHAQQFGWMDWAKNGQSAGTAGYAYRLEAIQIILVAKGGSAPGPTASPFRNDQVVYQSHVQDIGWQTMVTNGTISGTCGEAKRLEAILIYLVNLSGGVEYRTHVQNLGWLGWVSNGVASGTEGQSLRLEAIDIRLTGDAADQFDIYYRVHAQNIGWMDWAKNGQSAGTAGYAYRLEAIQIILEVKGSAAPGSTASPFIQK